jgi:hypothetical protein
MSIARAMKCRSQKLWLWTWINIKMDSKQSYVFSEFPLEMGAIMTPLVGSGSHETVSPSGLGNASCPPHSLACLPDFGEKTFRHRCATALLTPTRHYSLHTHFFN